MQKRYNIKWRKSDEKALLTAVRNFNAKRTRTIKKDPENADYLPEKVKMTDIMNNIRTRSDYRKELNRLKRFMKKGSEKIVENAYGVKTTAYEKKEIGLRVREINRRRKKELETFNPSTEKGTMGSVRENSLRPKKYDFDTMTARNWDKFRQSVHKQSSNTYMLNRYKQYQENYCSALINIFGNTSDTQEVITIVRQIDPVYFYNIYYDEPILQIDFIYSPHERADKLALIKEYLLYHVKVSNNPTPDIVQKFGEQQRENFINQDIFAKTNQ